MAQTTVIAGNQWTKFLEEFFRGYVRANRMADYAGSDLTSVINTKKYSAPTISHPLITRLSGAGVSGSTALVGSEEAIGNYAWTTNPTYFRNGVTVTLEEEEKTVMDILNAARPLLMEWSMDATRTRMVEALGAIYNGTTYAPLDASADGYYASAAAEAAKDTWQGNNDDRVIYGANITLTGDDSAELAGIDATNDTFTRARLDDMRRLAEDADPGIHPIRTDNNSEVYVVFAGSQAFRDLKEDLETLNSNADRRGMTITRDGNVLANDSDMFWNGCIVRKVPEITKVYSATGKALNAAGAAGIAVEPVFLCGAQALVWGMGSMPEIKIKQENDYDFNNGVAVALKEDIKKAYYNDVQHGVVTGYFSGAA